MISAGPDIGQTIAGRYRIDAVAGQGGMATVYRATDLVLGRTVALKCLTDRVATGADGSAYFLSEARTMAALVHPAIVTLYDVFEADDRHYLVIEYVEGRTLRTMLAGGAISPTEAVRIAAPLADALDFAHSRGTIHGDLKPENVLVTAAGKPKLTDFGIARLAMDASAMQTTILGTAWYLAPEQIEGAAPTQATDIYAFGLLLYEMLAGRLPFEGAAVRLGQDPPALTNLSPMLAEIVRRALARRPEDRYRTIGALRYDLEHVNDPAPPERTAKTERLYVGSSGTRPVADRAPESWVNETRPVRRTPRVRPKHGAVLFIIIAVLLTSLFALGSTVIAKPSLLGLTPVTNEPSNPPPQSAIPQRGGLEGSIVGPRGTAVGDATMEITGAMGTRRVSSNADGRFTVPDLTQGSYSIDISAPGYQATRSSADISSGQSTTRSFRLASICDDAAKIAGLEGLSVPARKSLDVPLPASAGQSIDLSVGVARGGSIDPRNLDIGVTLLDPNGITIANPGHVRQFHPSAIIAPASGTYTLRLDNSYSQLTGKNVTANWCLR